MISPSNRRQAVELIKEASASGASPAEACEVLDLSLRTYQRWTAAEGVKADAGRTRSGLSLPAN
jgi:putative transposase